MKGFASPIIIIILAIAAIAILAGGFLPGSLTGTCTTKEGLTVIPIMGYYECKIQDTDSVKDAVVHNQGYVFCGDDEYTKKCNMEIKCPTQQTWFFGLFPSNARLVYKTSRTENKYVTNVQSCSVGGTLLNEDVFRGDSLFVKVQTSDFWGNWHDVNDIDITIRQRWTSWGLWQESRTGASKWTNKEGCFVNAATPSYGTLCISGDDCVDGTTSNIRVGELDFSEATNYVEKWAIAPIEYNFVVYNGQQVYCGSGGIFNTETIQLQSGCYIYPSDRIATVDCCPDETAANAYCEDFKWVDKTTATEGCFSDMQCTGSGSWVPEYSDKSRTTVMIGACIDGTCGYETKKVQCSTNEACQSDQVCSNFKCVSQAPVGDLPGIGITGEDLGSFDIFGNLWGYLIMFITALIISTIVVGALGLTVFRMFDPVKNWRKAIGAIFILALFLTVMFAMPMGMIAAQIFG